MDISFAGFDWISLLVIIVAGIIGMVKSNGANKKKQYPVFPLPFEEDEKVDDYTIPVKYEAAEPIEMKSEISDDYYPEKRPMSGLQVTESPEEEIQAPVFDIRQAIISSEILKRPEF